MSQRIDGSTDTPMDRWIGGVVDRTDWCLRGCGMQPRAYAYVRVCGASLGVVRDKTGAFD